MPSYLNDYFNEFMLGNSKKKKKTLPIIVDVVTVWYKSIAFKAIIHTYIDTLRRVSFKKV